jgi:hypothetical protein
MDHLEGIEIPNYDISLDLRYKYSLKLFGNLNFRQKILKFKILCNRHDEN